MKKILALLFALAFTLPSIGGEVYSQAQQVVISTGTNGTTPAAMITTGKGTTTIDPSWMIANDVWRIHVRGSYTTSAVPPSLTIAIKLDTTAILTTTFSALVGSVTNNNFDADIEVGTRTAGTSGSLVAQGTTTMTGLTSNLVRMDLPAAVTTIDTTSSHNLTMTATWGSTTAGNSITVNMVTLYAQ